MRNDNDDKLPRELVWDGSHVSQLGLTALADGQESLLQSDAIAHATACEWCAGRMGRAALLSAAVGGAVEAVQPAAAVSRAPVSAGAGARPWVAMSLGLLVAVLAALPSLPHLTETLASLLATGRAFTTHGIPVLARGGIALASQPAVSRLLPMATVVSSALLVMMGWAIARTRTPVAVERSMS